MACIVWLSASLLLLLPGIHTLIQTGTILEAADHCGVDGLVGGGTDDEYLGLVNIMIKEKLQSLWMGIQRQFFSEPHWVSERIGPHEVQEEHVPDICFFLNSQDGTIGETHCDKKFGFIAAVPDCFHCSAFEGAACMVTDGTCFYIIKDTQQWYKARQICKEKNGDLAVLQNELLTKKLSDIAWRQNQHVRSFWVGKRTVDWGPTTGAVPLQHYFWFPGEPKLNHKYVKLQKQDESFSWNTANSSDISSYVCSRDIFENVDETSTRKSYGSPPTATDGLSYGLTTLPQNATIAAESVPERPKRLTVVGVVLIVIFGIILVCLIPLIYLIKASITRYRSIKYQEAKQSEDQLEPQIQKDSAQKAKKKKVPTAILR